MGLIPQDVIDRVLAAHDVAEVVGRYVQLKPTGRTFKALCPFHDEKTPSFTVNPDRQTFKCFGCGKGGTVLTFLTEFLKVTFPEAVRTLAAERGIVVPDGGGPAGPPPGELERLRGAVALAQKMFTHLLAADEGREARAYLEKRGYDAAARERFGLGYAPAGWDRLIQAGAARKIPATVLEAAGLVVPRTSGDGHYDRFRNRVTFPLKDPQGRVVSFGARALAPDDVPKYLNGPETPLFSKGSMLFALDLARDGIRRTHDALLMEGYTDVLMAHLHGFDRAVAGMGTAFTPRQASLLARSVEQQRVTLVYDADAAGRAAAEKTLDVLLDTGVDVRVALLPEGRDVDEILLEEGPPAFQAILDRSVDVFVFRSSQLAQRHDAKTPRGAAAIAKELGLTLARIKSPTEMALQMRRVADLLGGGTEAEAALRREVAAASSSKARTAAPATAPNLSERAGQIRAQVSRRDEQILLLGALAGGETADAVTRAVGAEDFACPVRRRVYKAVLDFREAAAPHDHRVLVARFSDDPEAAAELAGLPEEAKLSERVRDVIRWLEDGRLRGRHRADEHDGVEARLTSVMDAWAEKKATERGQTPRGAR
jgi:DNA primase